MATQARRIPLAVLLLYWCVSVSTPLAAALWYEHYAAAEQALAAERWSDAVNELNLALEKRGDSGARVRTYGMKVTAYFPYLKLGLAYFHLGQHQAALQAFDTEERLGAIADSERALAELQEYRRLASQALDAAREADKERIRAIVDAGLEEVARLERDGLLEAAIAELGRVLAVDPEEPWALEAQTRLRRQLGRAQEAESRRQRAADLIDRGREMLAEGNLSEAASLLRQALQLEPVAEAEELLEEAQGRLRRQLGLDRESEQRALVERALDEASRLGEAERWDEALEGLQPALAIDPPSAAALDLQERLLTAQAEASRLALKKQTIDQLLAATEEDLASGRYSDALTSTNRVLALDAENPRALEQLARAYRELNRRLLGATESQNFPPAIRFVDLRQEGEEGLLAEIVRSPAFRMSGVVIDDSPVEIAFFAASEAVPLDATLSSQPLGEFLLTEFRLDHRLRPGRTDIRLVAIDREKVSSSSEYTVIYRPPFYRLTWFYGLLAGVLLLGGTILQRRRSQARRRLRERRFNPYVAGAPVRNEELFVGRDNLLEWILQTLHNNSLLLHGERRIGKTTLQHHLKRRLEQLDDPEYVFYPVYVDLQGTPEDRFFATLAEEIFQELAPLLDGLQTGAPLTGPYAYRDFLSDLRAVLKVLKQKSDKAFRLVLLIDEVDELNSYDPRINQRLRGLFMKSFAENLVAVVSGVSIKRDWEREGSPWYNFFEEVEVTPFSAQEARDLIVRPIQHLFKFDDGVVDRLVEVSGGRPYLIQKLCMQVVNRMHSSGRSRIRLSDLEAVAAGLNEDSS